MKVSKKLKKRLEHFLQKYPSSEEFGGFLFSFHDVVVDFLPVPNLSDSPQTRFQCGNRAFDLAKKYAYAKRCYDVSAFFHSHPEPYIMSVADVMVSNNYPYSNVFFVMITSKKGYGAEWVWYASKGIKPEEIDFV